MKINYKLPVTPIVVLLVGAVMLCLGASALKNIQTSSTLTTGKVLIGNGNSTASPANLTWTAGNNTLTVGASGVGNVTGNVITGVTMNVTTFGATDMSLSNPLPGASGGDGVANTGTTLTRAGNVTFSGAFATNIIVSANTTATLLEGTYTVGSRDIDQNAQTGNYTVVLADLGKHIYHASGAAANTYTIPANATISKIGAAITFVNYSANNTTISLTTDTLKFYNGTAVDTGNRTLITGGVATALKTGAAEWTISGNGALQ